VRGIPSWIRWATLAAAIAGTACGSPNDAFANSADLGSPASATIPYDGRDATRQVGEPSHSSNNSTGSLWWRWTAPASGQLWLKVVAGGANRSAIRAVYTGTSLNGLAKVAETGGSSVLAVPVVAGGVYRIAVPDESVASLNLEFFPMPGNDAFESRGELGAAADFTLEGSTVGATLQAGEPGGSSQGPTLWWSWQAPLDGIVTYDVAGSDSDFWNAGVYSGTTLGTLVKRTGRTYGQAMATPNLLRVKAGESFSILVSGMSIGQVGKFRVNWQLMPQPFQATPAEAVDLGSVASATGRADNRGSAAPTLWWRWTPPANGVFRWIATRGDGGPGSPILRAYDANQQLLVTHSIWKAYPCRAGQPCLLSLSTSESQAGIHDYQLIFEAADPNDDLAAALPLEPGDYPFNFAYSSLEAAEPVIPAFTWGRSLWWEWTAPGDVALWLDFDRGSLGVWGLDPVATGFVTPYGSRQTMLAAAAGSRHRIGVLESDILETSPGTLSARLIPKATGNDAFADAAELGPGWTVAGFGDPAGATREAGEPSPIGHGGSLWWKWTAPGNGHVRIRSRAPGSGEIGTRDGLWLYRGAGLGSLVPMTSTAVAGGETLWLAVTGNSSGVPVPIAFELRAEPAHPNDAFAAATDLGGIASWQPSFHLDATAEAGEPVPQRSLWWKWTAPEAGNVFFDVTAGSALCSVYQGSSLADLVLVADSSGTPDGRFAAMAGTTYWVAVTGADPSYRVSLDWRLTAPPPGDWFADPVELGQLVSFALIMADGSLMEPVESALFPAGYNQSLWWRWTAPADGKLAVETLWKDRWLLYEESGGPGAGLTLVPDENVVAGRHYRIANIAGPYTSASPSTWTFHATPPNDVPAGAIDLGNSTALASETDLYAATVDPAETAILPASGNPPRRAVWWKWTAPFDGVLQCRGEITSNSSGDAMIAVLRGDHPATWQTVAQANSSSSSGVTCQVAVKAGNLYHILLGSPAYSADLAQLTLSAWPAPSNNDWTDATDLGSGTAANVAGGLAGATRDSFEGSGSGGSVWWKWTAPAAGNAFVMARIGASSPGLGVYQLSGGALIAVPGAGYPTSGAAGNLRSFRAESGRTYWFSVLAGDTAAGEAELALRLTGIPANDDFAQRIPLAPELPQVISGETGEATVEAGEETYDSSSGNYRNRSLWWSWTAPASGPVRLDFSGLNTVYVYTGAAIDALTTVTRAPSGKAAWFATAGVTYHICAGSSGVSGGPIGGQLVAMEVSANDHFAGRTGLGQVVVGQWAIDTLLCSAETGEPAHGGKAAAFSVWHEWTAPSTGGFLLQAAVENTQARLGIYTGGAVDGLQSVAGGTWKALLPAVAGQTYQIAVDGPQGSGSLSLQPLDPPANDLFADRILLTGWPLPIKGDTILAGKEAGEPGSGPTSPQRTLWWEWVAPSSASYRIEAPGINSAILAIYSSSGPATGFASLALVTTFSGNGGSFSTTAGRHYYFKAYTTTTTAINTEFDFRIDTSTGIPPAPPNDDFASRSDLGSAVGIKITGDLYGSTREPWESISPNQGSLWWSWTAPADGIFGLRRSVLPSVTMTVFTGSTPASLVTAASGSGTIEWFQAVAGTTYQIRVASSSTSRLQSSAGFVGLEVVAGVVPVNDRFAAATVLPEPGTTSVEGYNAGAGAEATEPAHSGSPARASVWYQWTASVAGPIQISTSFATLRAAVYLGDSLAALTPVAAGNTTLTFTAVAGERYRIALDSNGAETFLIRLNPAAPPISNDAFAAATPLAGATAEVAGSTVAATLEADEPYHTGSGSQGGSAWWSWTAPATGAVEVLATASSPPHLAIYQGVELKALQLVASGSGSCRFQASSGTTYRIAASATSSTGLPFALKLQAAGDTPANDGFADAPALDPEGRVTGTLAGASREIGESWHGANPVVQTVWYRWTAPAGGRARVAIESGNPGNLVVYRGTTLAGLTEVVAATNEAGFAVVAGEEFRIMVGLGSPGDPGVFDLAIGMMDTGDNDSFANRLDLGSSAQVAWTGTFEEATIEPGEIPYEYYDNGSRWWSWTAPADGGVSLRRETGSYGSAIHVYSGTEPGSLALLATGSSGLSFPARAGAVYQIALRGKPNSTGIGDFQASLVLESLPNDRQAAATPLAGVLPVSGSAWLAGATAELGENPGYGSLWWRWVAPASGPVDLDTTASDFHPGVAVWTGAGLPLLESLPLATIGDRVTRFTAVAGTSYWISLTSTQITVFGTVRFQLREAKFATNDLFANALPLAGETFVIDTVNHGATTEPGEPVPRSRPYTNTYSRSLWWKWVAPRDGLLRVTVSKGWAFLYEGASWQELKEVAGPGGYTDQAYWVEAGREYVVSAGNSSGGPVVATLALSPPGDRFQDARPIAGTWVKQSGSLAGCFWEPGEPLHAGSAAQATMWFRWQAPSSGSFRVMAGSGATTLRAAAYSGNAITGLTERGAGKGGFVFTAQAGIEYHIAVDGGSPAGAFEFVLAEEIPAYAVWRDARFDFMDPASAPDADPDHDGRPNLLEASLGSHPLTFDPGPVFTFDSVLGTVRLNLRRPAAGTSWAHSFEIAETLGGWQSTLALNRSETVEAHDDGTETLHVLLPDYRFEDFPKLFFRLRVAPRSLP
jgi:hypothetical protein